ncbi:MAG: hypothetical protein R3B45_13045 [Bdellovibrionota bacterium]
MTAMKIVMAMDSVMRLRLPLAMTLQTTSNTSKYADLSPDLSVSDGDKDMDNDGIANWYEAKYDMNSLDR